MLIPAGSLISGSVSQDNNQKENKLFMKASWEYCFLMVKNCNCLNQSLVNFSCKRLDGKYFRLCKSCSIWLMKYFCHYSMQETINEM